MTTTSVTVYVIPAGPASRVADHCRVLQERTESAFLIKTPSGHLQRHQGLYPAAGMAEEARRRAFLWAAKQRCGQMLKVVGDGWQPYAGYYCARFLPGQNVKRSEACRSISSLQLLVSSKSASDELWQLCTELNGQENSESVFKCLVLHYEYVGVTEQPRQFYQLLEIVHYRQSAAESCAH